MDDHLIKMYIYKNTSYLCWEHTNSYLMKRPPRSQGRLSSSFEKVSLPKQEESEPWKQVDEVVGSTWTASNYVWQYRFNLSISSVFFPLILHINTTGRFVPKSSLFSATIFVEYELG